MQAFRILIHEYENGIVRVINVTLNSTIMKSQIIILIIGMLSVVPFNLNAQGKKVVEDTITVEGICGMCKERIEQAAYGKGVKFASWTNESSELALAYRPDKVSLREIEERIAAAGHSTDSVQATRASYEQLPDCCRYEHMHKH